MREGPNPTLPRQPNCNQRRIFLRLLRRRALLGQVTPPPWDCAGGWGDCSRRGGCATKAEGVCQLVFPGVRTCAPFEDEILHSWMGVAGVGGGGGAVEHPNQQRDHPDALKVSERQSVSHTSIGHRSQAAPHHVPIAFIRASPADLAHPLLKIRQHPVQVTEHSDCRGSGVGANGRR